MKKLIFKSILAGMLISFAGIIYLECENKIIGAFLFSIGLIGVISLNANLYTGKVGYINSKKSFTDVIIILIFNIITAYIIGFIYKQTIKTEINPMLTRLEKSYFDLFFDSVICGVLIYLAVELYKKTSKWLVVIICVMGFILSGMEHSIADAFYFGVSDFEFESLIVLLIIIFGNGFGSLLIRKLQTLCEKE